MQRGRALLRRRGLGTRRAGPLCVIDGATIAARRGIVKRVPTGDGTGALVLPRVSTAGHAPHWCQRWHQGIRPPDGARNRSGQARSPAVTRPLDDAVDQLLEIGELDPNTRGEQEAQEEAEDTRDQPNHNEDRAPRAGRDEAERRQGGDERV